MNFVVLNPNYNMIDSVEALLEMDPAGPLHLPARARSSEAKSA